MSYIKISQLPIATGITNDDYFVIVDAPGTTPVTRKIAFSGLADTVLGDLVGGSGIFITHNVASGTFTIDAYIDGGNI